jgi:hypothetical protein
MDDHRKIAPPCGWHCFHCGDVFHTQEDAENHFGIFGETLDGDWDPACIQRLNYSEKALRAALMDMFRELEAEREAGHEMGEILSHLQGLPDELARLFDGARTPHQAWLKWESMEGRALAAEEFRTRATIALGKYVAGYRPGQEGWTPEDQAALDEANRG